MSRWMGPQTFVIWLALGFAGQCLPAHAVPSQPASRYEAVIRHGKAELQAGHADEALSSGEEAIKLDARNWEGYALAGGAQMNLKRYEEAADDFTKALKLAPADKQPALSNIRRQCLLAAAGVEEPAAAATPTPASPAAPPSKVTQAEIVLWETIKTSSNPEDFQTYLKQYPQGAFAALAQRHLAELEKGMWQSIENSTDPDAFRSYLKQYPNGTFVKDAQTRLAAAEIAQKAELLQSLMPNVGQIIPGTRWSFQGFGISESADSKSASDGIEELGSNARTVDWSINVSAEKGSEGTAGASCEYFDSVGNPISGRMNSQLTLQPKDRGGSFVQGWGSPNGGSWPAGSYQVRCGIAGTPFLRERFTVESDPIFSLDHQKGVHSVALILLSDGQLAYTARDYWGNLRVSRDGVVFKSPKGKSDFEAACSELSAKVTKSQIKITHAGKIETLAAGSQEDAARVLQAINSACGK